MGEPFVLAAQIVDVSVQNFAYYLLLPISRGDDGIIVCAAIVSLKELVDDELLGFKIESKPLPPEVGVALRIGFGLGLGLGLSLGLSLGFGCSFGGSLGVCEDPVGGQRPARL